MPKRVPSQQQQQLPPQFQQAGAPQQQQPTGTPMRQDSRQDLAGAAQAPPTTSSKRVKREAADADSRPLVDAGGPAKRARQALPTDNAAQAAAVPGTPSAAPSPARARAGAATPGVNGDAQASAPGATTTNISAAPTNGRRRRSGEGVAWILSEVRTQLEAIADVEGVPELLDRFPECVLLGGIAARRELVANLLGEHAVAVSAAALLVAPGMRQPVALELRCGSEDFGPANGPEAEAWLRSVAQAAGQALGNRLKVDPLRLRLSAMGCANIDVIDLPERSGAAGASPKIEEMRTRHVGSAANLLVCLEPGAPLDLCRRFDPQLKRTVLIGAAASAAQAGGDDSLPVSTLCGPAAALALEERFATLCKERLPQWLQHLERLEMRLSRSQKEARELERREAGEEVLMRARSAGISFGRALQNVISGAPGCQAGALTLEEELAEFASSCARGQCETGDSSRGRQSSAQEAADAANEIFNCFGGVTGYSNYLREQVRIPASDVPLNGGAAWQRLLAEIEVAMRLAHPPQKELESLMVTAMRAAGTGVHGHQRWEDVASKLMLSVSFEPLRRRVRYVAARVVWLLKHQKATVSEWMSMLSEGPASRRYSPLFTEHLDVLRSYPIVRDLVFTAYDKAASGIGEQVLKNLESTLVAACVNPDIMLRPSTEPELDPRKSPPEEAKASGSGRSSAESRKRVAVEMKRRSGSSGGLPVQLQDRIFEPSEAQQTMPFVEAKLRKAFAVLARVLANQALAFADASMTYLYQRRVDEAMTAIAFSPEQNRALSSRHEELKAVADQVEHRLLGVRRCISALRSGGLGMSRI